MTIEVVVGVGDSVYIPAIETKGRVISIVLALCGTQYEIAYWFEGKRQSAYLFDCEFTKEKQTP